MLGQTIKAAKVNSRQDTLRCQLVNRFSNAQLLIRTGVMYLGATAALS